jgi:hypothetical protein
MHDASGLVAIGLEAGDSLLFAHEPLIGLQRALEIVEQRGAEQDQINLIVAAVGVQKAEIEDLQDGRRARGERGRGRVHQIVAPEGVGASSDATNGRGCRDVGDEMLQAADGLAAVLRIGVEQRGANGVVAGRHTGFDLGLDEVQDARSASVLDVFKPVLDDVRIELLPSEVGGGQNVGSLHVQEFGAGIPARGRDFSIEHLFGKLNAAIGRICIALLLEDGEQCVVVGQ